MPAKKTVIDCTRGLSREERTIARRNRRESLILSGSDGRRRRGAGWLDKQIDKSVKLRKELLALRAAEAAEDERLFKLEHPNQVLSSIPFEEKEFGYYDSPDKECQELGFTIDRTARMFDIVVSLALFDGDKMLFACSGVAVPSGMACKLDLTRFVTSRHLVDEYNKNRNLDDKLRIDVCLPNNRHKDGFLGLYDEQIAIVTSCDCGDYVSPVNLDIRMPRHYDCMIIAAARASKSGHLMVTAGELIEDGDASWKKITEAALGGPIIGYNSGEFLGVNLYIDNAESSKFMSTRVLHKRLQHFQILNTETIDFRGYSLPAGVFSIVPSGFWRRVKRLKSAGYPMPPPLVLEFNGELLNTFEEEFGELRAWKEYPYKVTNPDSWEYVWGLLPRDVVTNISRSVVKLASFNGTVRSFACTGLLIKWPGTKGMRPVILTSASLVRDRDYHHDIDKNLTIDVFLPPAQHSKGTLIYYHLGINIAIVNLDKGFHGIRPVDLCREEDLSKPVVAIARQIEEGFLMATKGEVRGKPRFSYYGLSTCKINKAGIGGPLLNFDGAFVGMNHYDGEEASFLPRRKIVEILKKEINKRKQRGSMGMLHGVRKKRCWPVPEPYWRHGLLDVDLYELPKHIGRTLM